MWNRNFSSTAEWVVAVLLLAATIAAATVVLA